MCHVVRQPGARCGQVPREDGTGEWTAAAILHTSHNGRPEIRTLAAPADPNQLGWPRTPDSRLWSDLDPKTPLRAINRRIDLPFPSAVASSSFINRPIYLIIFAASGLAWDRFMPRRCNLLANHATLFILTRSGGSYQSTASGNYVNFPTDRSRSKPIRSSAIRRMPGGAILWSMPASCLEANLTQIDKSNINNMGRSTAVLNYFYDHRSRVPLVFRSTSEHIAYINYGQGPGHQVRYRIPGKTHRPARVLTPNIRSKPQPHRRG